MQSFQLSLFYDIQYFLLHSDFHKKYYLLFKALDLSYFPSKNFGVGRTGYSRRAILRAFIVKHIEQIKTVPRLIAFLDAHPILTEMCGFEIGCIPDDTKFYRFLKDTPNSQIEKIHHRANRKLLEKGILSKDTFILDSKPIKAATRENNPKNPSRNNKDKTKKPKRNPAATLGYYSYQNKDGKKKSEFYWGYRTHVIISKEGIPLVEVTLPNSYTDAKVAKRLIRKLKRVYGCKKNSKFIADAGYDDRELYDFIVKKLKCKPYIPINPRNKQPDKTLGPHGAPICEAGIEMKSAGISKDKRSTRIKYWCPVKCNKKAKRKYPEGCPINHFRFTEGKKYGCTKYIDITNDARARVPRDSADYKNNYKLRTEVERYFARLGDREAEKTTHYKLRSIQNQMTIAHLSLTLVAVAAAIILEQPEKIRCYLTFPKNAHLTIAA